MEDWKASQNRKELVAIESMDVSKAFDTIPHWLLLGKVSTCGQSGSVCVLFEDHLRRRMQSWRCLFKLVGFNRGVPQRSVLGPMFFNLLEQSF